MNISAEILAALLLGEYTFNPFNKKSDVVRFAFKISLPSPFPKVREIKNVKKFLGGY